MFKYSLLVCVLFVLLSSCSNQEQLYYSNSWAVEVKGGPEAAQKLAEKHGFIYKGQVGSLDGVYHFIHEESPSRERRSASSLHPKHHDLMAEHHVTHVEQQVAKSRVKRDDSYVYSPPTNTRWKDQWYLHRSSGHHMNIELVWEQDIIGRGSVVSILDDGLEYSHTDLKDNYDPDASYDFNAHDPDPFPRYDPTNENKHGTRCAGEVAARRDGRCGVGAAYGAKVGGVRMLDDRYIIDVVEASSLSFNPQHIEIYSNSWGPYDDGKTVDGPGRLVKQAFEDGINKGCGGLGSIFVWAAGNGGLKEDSCNCDGYAMSPYTISVGSASERDKKPWYVEVCSSTLASTYSSGGNREKQIVSTDIHGVCTTHHTGTSAAAPLAAGILALVLEANRNLTWRDMQYLLVYSSNPHFPEDSGWQTNGAGLMVSHLYGFGIIDSAVLVNRARNWVTVHPRKNCTINVTSLLEEKSVASSGHPLEVKATTDCHLSYLEHVQAFTTLSLLSGVRGDISIFLTSPMGTVSTLLPFRGQDRLRDGFHEWPFMTVFSWAESAKGEWAFRVETRNGARVSLDALEMVLYGTKKVSRVLRDIPTQCDDECDGGCAKPGPQYCDKCKNVRLSSTMECVSQCPVGTFKNYHMCRDCSELCAECEDDHSCVRCEEDAVKLQTGLCGSACPELMYSDLDKTCQSCHHSCLTCDGPSELNCTECPGQLSLQDGACILRSPSSCSTGRFFDHRAFECRLCHTSCMNCTGKGKSDCAACYDGYSLNNVSECVSDASPLGCDPGYYLNTSNGSHCVQCSSGCANCTDEVTCYECVSGHFLMSTGSCVSACPERAIADNVSSLCVDTSCHETCLTCFGNEINECLSCPEGWLFYQNFCLKGACPKHTFMVVNSSCQECHENCASCSGPQDSDCLSCPNSSYHHLGNCLISCPTETFPFEAHCSPCLAHCANCSSPSVCTLCTKGYLLMPSTGECVGQCPDGYVHHAASHSCKPCLHNCKECSDLSSCDRCEESFAYYAPNCSCLTICPNGYYDMNGRCVECKSPCSSCKSEHECTVCGRGTAMDKATNSCRPCCNADRASVSPCCDCDTNDRICVLVANPGVKSVIPPQGTMYDYTGWGRTVVWGGGVVVGVLLVAVVIFVTVYVTLKRRKAREVKMYHQVPPGEGVEAMDIRGGNRGSKFFESLKFPRVKKQATYQRLSSGDGHEGESESEEEVFSAKI